MLAELSNLFNRHEAGVVINLLSHIDKASLKRSQISESRLFSIIFCLVNEFSKIAVQILQSTAALAQS